MRTGHSGVEVQVFCRLHRTKQTTEAIAKVTTAVAGAVGTAIGSVAQGAVSTAKRSGVAKEGSTSRHAARVGKAGLVALVEVFDAMHDAGRKVVKEGATETATCVQYRCGASDIACPCVGNEAIRPSAPRPGQLLPFALSIACDGGCLAAHRCSNGCDPGGCIAGTRRRDQGFALHDDTIQKREAWHRHGRHIPGCAHD